MAVSTTDLDCLASLRALLTAALADTSDHNRCRNAHEASTTVGFWLVIVSHAAPQQRGDGFETDPQLKFRAVRQCDDNEGRTSSRPTILFAASAGQTRCDAVDATAHVGAPESFCLSIALSRKGTICGPSSGVSPQGARKLWRCTSLSSTGDIFIGGQSSCFPSRALFFLSSVANY
jgi:hypothetical protein